MRFRKLTIKYMNCKSLLPFCFLCIAIQCFSQQNIIYDFTRSTALNDGMIALCEYPGYSTGINSGFGDVIGENSEFHFDSDTAGNLNIGLVGGGGDFNDYIVIYIDAVPGGFSSTSSLTDVTGVEDEAISAIGLDINFATGFEADYAIAISYVYGGFLYQLYPDDYLYLGTLTTTLIGSTGFEMNDFNLSDMGLNPGDSFKYIITYLSPTAQFRSDEFHGVSTSTVPPGGITESITLGANDYNEFVSVSPQYTNQRSAYRCKGDSVFLEGEYRKESGTYNDTLISMFGCDSVIITALEIYPSYDIFTEKVICDGDSILWQDTYYKIPGSYAENYSTDNGCDSIYKLELIVHSKPPNFAITGESQAIEYQLYQYSVPSNPDLTYTWAVSSGNIIEFNSNNSVQIQWGSTGNGRITSISENALGCKSDTSLLDVTINSTTGVLTEPFKIGMVNIYPNPAIDLISIESEISAPFLINLTSPNGQLLYSKTMEGTSYQFDLSSFHKGIYFITIRSNDFVTTKKIIKL